MTNIDTFICLYFHSRQLDTYFMILSATYTHIKQVGSPQINLACLSAFQGTQGLPEASRVSLTGEAQGLCLAELYSSTSINDLFLREEEESQLE